jgi:hypothetical protein
MGEEKRPFASVPAQICQEARRVVHDVIMAERHRIKGMTWTRERLEKLDSGGFLFRYRRCASFGISLVHKNVLPCRSVLTIGSYGVGPASQQG